MRAPEFWVGRGPWATSMPPLLSPLSGLYDGLGRLRRALASPESVDVPVICVGNVVSGGAGKTPTALGIAARLAARGLRPHFLSRGYGGRLRGPVQVDPARHATALVGDEPLLLAARAPTWVARQRPAGARAAVAAGAEVLVMDDGHQNPDLQKDLSLIVVDAAYGFGNGRVMPAGPLREPPAVGLGRADGVVLIEGAGTLSGLDAEIAALAPDRPLLRARLEPSISALPLAESAVVAFAGIGRPEKFFATLEELGCQIVGRHAFADHQPYDPDTLMRIVEEAAAKGARPVTTAKDAVRLPPEARAMVEVVEVGIVFAEETAIEALLEGALAPFRTEAAP